MSAAVHILVHGRVQGVFFRAFTCDKAAELDLAGWVRNLPDGNVEIHAEGEKEHLEQFIEWCRQGPPAARVTSLDLDWVPLQKLKSFVVR